MQVTLKILRLIASEIWGYHRGVAEDSSHQGCYVLSPGKL